jgi:hemoglobin
MRDVRNPMAPSPPVAAKAADTDALHNPHFVRIGGSSAVTRLVDAFYAQMDQLPEARAIRALHPADLAPVKDVLTRYLTEWLGGPSLYSSERGHPRLRRRHRHFPIDEAARDAWMLCMTRALDQVVEDPALRQTLAQAFFRTADFIRNDARTTGHNA